jgi:AAA family ATP:ADP antiporter
MARLAVATGSDSTALDSPDALVRPALVAAGLLVAHQVAAKATRDALFLSNFSVTVLPIVSGAAAALSLAGALAFSRWMARSSPPILLRRVMAASAMLFVGEWALSLAVPRLATVAVYLHVAVFGATVMSGFWSVVNERFDPHTARRVVGRIGTGAALGGVLGGLLTWRAADLFGLPTMLLVLAGLTLGGLLLLERVHGPGPLPPPPSVAPQGTPGPARAFELIRHHSYLRNVSLVVGLCAVTEAVLDYVLNAGVVARFGRGARLVSFFALYHTAVGALALGVQTAFARRSLERLGLAGTLAVPPAVVALGGLLTSLVPGFWPRVALRGTQAVLANSLFRSAYELLYTPVAPDRKRPTKALLDVGADRVGTMVGSAAVLLVLLMPAAAAPRILLLLATGLAVVTLILTRRLHRGYVGELAESLRAGTVRLAPDDVMDPATRAALARQLSEPPSPAPRAETLGEEAAELRSGDAGRMRAVLTRDRPLEAELIPLVVPLLARDDLFTDVVAALRRVGPRCTGQLVDVLLDPEQDPLVRRRVPRVLKAVPTQRALDGLLIALRDARFDVRYRSVQALVRLRHRNPSLSLPPAEAFAAAQSELAGGRPSVRGLEHVVGLISLGLPGEPLQVALRAWRSGDRSLRGTALEYLENVLPSALWARLWPWLGSRPVSSGRTLEEVREDLLRSTRSWSLARRSKSRTGPRGTPE